VCELAARGKRAGAPLLQVARRRRHVRAGGLYLADGEQPARRLPAAELQHGRHRQPGHDLPAGQLAYVVISHDEGASETWIAEPDAPTATVISGTNLQLAVDDADNLYAIWTAGGVLHLAISRDRAQSWSAPMTVSAPGATQVARPAIAAGSPGHVAVTYYATREPSAELLSAYITQTADALDAQPLFYSGALNDPAHPIFRDFGLGGGPPRTDFVGGAFDSPGTSFWAGVVKQFGPPENGKIPTVGYVGTLRSSSLTPSSLP
jgi:hypothetical protein